MSMISISRQVVFGAAAVLMTLACQARADSLDRHIRLVNHSDQTITSFRASDVGSRNWGSDRLGPYVLPPSYSIILNLDEGTGYCMFDFRTVTDEGNIVVRPAVNVCELTQYTLV